MRSLYLSFLLLLAFGTSELEAAPDMAVAQRFHTVQRDLRRFWSEQLQAKEILEAQVETTVFQVVRGSQVLIRVPKRGTQRLERLGFRFSTPEGAYNGELEGLHARGREDYHWHVLRIPFRIQEPIVLTMELEFSEVMRGSIFKTATEKKIYTTKAALPALDSRLTHALVLEFDTDDKIVVQSVDLDTKEYNFSGVQR